MAMRWAKGRPSQEKKREEKLRKYITARHADASSASLGITCAVPCGFGQTES